MANKAQLNNNQTMSISYIIDKINKSGYKSLTPEEDKFYRDNYKNIVKVEDDGSYSTELPAVTIKNNPVKDAVYRGGKFPQLVADTAYTFASTPSAFVGETMNLLHGKMPNYKNITRYETQQFPSQQLGITNPYAAVVVNTMTDPIALYGVGKGIAQGGIKALQAYSTASNIGRNAARNTILKNAAKDVIRTTGKHVIDSAKKTYLPTINKPLEVMDVGLNLSHNLPTSNPMPYIKPTINTGNKLASTDINRKLGGKINKQRIIKKSLNMSNKYEYGGRIGDETFNVGNLRKGNTSGDSLRTMLGSNKIRISTRQPKWALNNGPIRKQRNLGLQAKYAKLGGRLYQVAGKTQLNAMPVDTGYTAPAIPNTNYYAPANSTYVNKNDTNRLKLAQEKERKRKEEYNKQLYQQGKIEPKYYSVADARQSYIDGGVAALKTASIPDAVMGETANYILNKDKFDYKNLYSDHPEFIGDALHIQNPYVKFGVNAVLSPLGGKFKVIKGMEGLSNAEKALVLSKSFGKRVEHSLLKPSVVETPVNTYHFSHIKDDNNTKNKPHKTGGIIKRKRY